MSREKASDIPAKVIYLAKHHNRRISKPDINLPHMAIDINKYKSFDT